MKTILQISMALLLAGVTMGQNSASKLVFYRVDDVSGNALHLSIKIDGLKAVHKLRNARYWTTEVAAGEHLIYGDDESDGRKYQVEVGKTYYFRIESRCTDSFYAQMLNINCKSVPVPVTAKVAGVEMVGLRPDKP